jgi:hypothetical protein
MSACVQRDTETKLVRRAPAGTKGRRAELRPGTRNQGTAAPLRSAIVAWCTLE